MYTLFIMRIEGIADATVGTDVSVADINSLQRLQRRDNIWTQRWRGIPLKL